LQLAQQAVEIDPEYGPAYRSLGFAYKALGKLEEAAEARRRTVLLRGVDRNNHFNYLQILSELGDDERVREAARNALPVFDRYLRLTLDDMHSKVQYALVLGMAGEHARAVAEARELEKMEGLDSHALYNLSCLFLREHQLENGLAVLRKSVGIGFRGIEFFLRDPDLDPLRGMPEFEELKMKVMAVEANG